MCRIRQIDRLGRCADYADAWRVGDILKTIADLDRINAVGVDIGGATTDVFSVFGGTFNRTVSANLGMSYSISNVLAEATLPMILRWIPYECDHRDLRNRVKNKMIRPTTIPQTLDALIFEQAVAREALRLSLCAAQAIRHNSGWRTTTTLDR